MEEKIAPLEVPVSSDLDAKKNNEVDSGGSNTNRQDINDVSMPICFLVKEQAKSLIAIQDLQKRVETIENVQDDVIDSLAEIRKYLCNDSRIFSGLNTESPLSASNQTPSISALKLDSLSKSKTSYSPLSFKEESKSPKQCDANKLSPSVQISDHSEKQFESKNKELALESDKQDSGLDSDCREVHDHLSLNRPSINWVKPESGDELLELLDEISQRTEVLQKQLAVIDQKNSSDDDQSDFPILPTKKLEKIQSLVQQEGSLKASASCLSCPKFPTTVAGAFMEESMARRNSNESERYDSKSLSERVHKIQKRAANKIDSAMVSSILKETNVVDLQRQVLIYLVENAVLHTKLGELEQLLSSKTMESNKIENSLKDETRLLMMENRELRIGLDEQKLETNSLRSKVLMMERVLQSISVENRELTWQLGESLGIQNLARKEPRKFSSFTCGNSSNSKFSRRSSLPNQFSCQTDTNISCVKSKLLSNASSFLDVTVEEPEQWSEVQTHGITYENHAGPVQSSTPLAAFTKLKDVKNSMNNPSPNFQSLKKRFKSTEKDSLFKSRNMETHLDEVPHDTHPETCIKSVKFNASNFEDSTTKFPFNTILEKLKANSDYRLSKRTSLAQTNEMSFAGDHIKSTALGTGRLTASGCAEGVTTTENLRQNSQSKNFQSRKGKNIHQRIQDILDRIMSESEEAT